MTGEWEQLYPMFLILKKGFSQRERKTSYTKKRTSKDIEQQEEEALTKNNKWETLTISRTIRKTKNTFQEVLIQNKSTISMRCMKMPKEAKRKLS